MPSCLGCQEGAFFHRPRGIDRESTDQLVDVQEEANEVEQVRLVGLVDSGFTVSKSRILVALNRLSSDPIVQLLNTPWHTDHTDGNAVHNAGAKITAHINTKKHLSASTRVEGWDWTFPSAPSRAIPGFVFEDDHRLQHDETNISLKYYGPAHTDSDVYIVFEEADIFQIGDTLWNGIYPFHRLLDWWQHRWNDPGD